MTNVGDKWHVSEASVTPRTGEFGVPSYQVSGKVTFEGRPVPLGEVSFSPDVGRGNQGRGVICSVLDGEYSTPRELGLAGGPYIAVVRGFERALASDDISASEFGRLLFRPQRMTIELPKEDATHDFDL